MPWPSSLSQRPPGTSADDGKDNTKPSPPKGPTDTDEKPTGHEPPPPTSTIATDPDCRFSFISPTTPSTSTVTAEPGAPHPQTQTPQASPETTKQYTPAPVNTSKNP